MFASAFFGLALLPFISATVHDVQVGGDGGALVFVPEAIAAQPGDQVVFHFNPKNHTVTQSSFANPCGLKDGGFDSGFMPVAANQTDNKPTFSVTVSDTQPIWVYCKQAANTPASHCGAGMVFAVNCGQDGEPNSFTNFKKAALAVGASLSAAAASPSATATATSWTTAAYGGVTIPPAPEATPVTQTVTLASSVWTTTYSSYPGSSNPTPVAVEGAVHTVIVGGPGKLAYDPPFVNAQPRDTIVFEFHQKNHTVTQSSFADPCRKLDGGFDSDFQPVADNATQFPTWSLKVNDTNPTWAYCRQKTPASHCGAGMVFAINPVQTSDRNFTAFQNLAKTLNGTAAAASSAPSATSTSNNNSAVSMGFSSAGLAAIVALVFTVSL